MRKPGLVQWDDCRQLSGSTTKPDAIY